MGEVGWEYEVQGVGSGWDRGKLEFVVFFVGDRNIVMLGDGGRVVGGVNNVRFFRFFQLGWKFLFLFKVF